MRLDDDDTTKVIPPSLGGEDSRTALAARGLLSVGMNGIKIIATRELFEVRCQSEVAESLYVGDIWFDPLQQTIVASYIVSGFNTRRQEPNHINMVS